MKKPKIEPKKRKWDESDATAFVDFVEEFQGESDRAAVIIGTAKLDYLLYQVLGRYLVPTGSSSDELLDGDSPLSTFSAKINICHRLGLIDSEFARTLHLVRKIRNSFAHEVTGCRLDAGPHRDRVKALIGAYDESEAFADIRRAFIDDDKKGAAADFFTILALMVMRLEAMFGDMKTLTLPRYSSLFPMSYQSIFQPTDADDDSNESSKSQD